MTPVSVRNIKHTYKRDSFQSLLFIRMISKRISVQNVTLVDFNYIYKALYGTILYESAELNNSILFILN